ncbi:unnamed protein product [Ectocarpus sp. 13 AM-2016]
MVKIHRRTSLAWWSSAFGVIVRHGMEGREGERGQEEGIPFLLSVHFQIVLALWCPFTPTLSDRMCSLGGEHSSHWRRVKKAQYRGDRVAIFAPNLARD